MFGERLKKKYALTDKGLENTKKGAFWTIIVNLISMAGMGILYFLMEKFIKTHTEGAALPPVWLFIALTAAFAVLSLITHLQQYTATYGLVYNEIKTTRITLAERMRRLPLGYFGKRDLADLTETVMGDVNRLEHVWSHCLGYLYGACISTGIIAVMLFVYDWRMALACLWGVPVAFLLLFGSRRISKRLSVTARRSALSVADGIQEGMYINVVAENGYRFDEEVRFLINGNDGYVRFMFPETVEVAVLTSYFYVENGGSDTLAGDVDSNGAVETADALLTLRSLMLLESLDEAQLAAADVDTNGEVNITDAIIILRIALGIR